MLFVFRYLQFIAASDKLWFMLEMYSFVDYFTIPPSFVSIYLQRTWIGKTRNGFTSTLEHKLRLLFYHCRSSLFESASTYDSSRYFAIFKCIKDIQFDSFSTTCFDFHIGLVDSGWNYSFGDFYENNNIILYFTSFTINFDFVFQLENSGDPLSFENSQPLSYWTCVYFLIVTMSTVGYGDVYCETVLGRTFLVFFLLVGLVSTSNSNYSFSVLVPLLKLN